jgi:hypothetical protein
MRGAKFEYVESQTRMVNLTAELRARAEDGWRPIAFIPTSDDGDVTVVFERTT